MVVRAQPRIPPPSSISTSWFVWKYGLPLTLLATYLGTVAANIIHEQSQSQTQQQQPQRGKIVTEQQKTQVVLDCSAISASSSACLERCLFSGFDRDLCQWKCREFIDKFNKCRKKQAGIQSFRT